MSEHTLNRHESFQDVEQRMMAHGWVTKLANDLLAVAETDHYAEYVLGTDANRARQMLDIMTLGDLLVPPGNYLGRVRACNYEGNSDNVYDDDKMGLYLGAALQVPKEPSRISFAVSSEQFAANETPLRYVALAFDYAVGNRTGRQMVGLAAHPDGYVDAMHISYCDQGEESIFKEASTRDISHQDTQIFVDCARELFTLPRELYV